MKRHVVKIKLTGFLIPILALLLTLQARQVWVCAVFAFTLP